MCKNQANVTKSGYEFMKMWGYGPKMQQFSWESPSIAMLMMKDSPKNIKIARYASSDA